MNTLFHFGGHFGGGHGGGAGAALVIGGLLILALLFAAGSRS